MSTWIQKFEHPAVLAATVASVTTLCITLVTAGSALWTAHIQSVTDIDKSTRDTKRELIVSAADVPALSTAEAKVAFYIKSGVLEDKDCKVQIAILHSTDCKPQ